MEYLRTDTHHFCDAVNYMIIDRVTGKPQRFRNCDAMGTLEDALEYVSNYTGWETRYVIVKLNCIEGFRYSSSRIVKN